MFNMFQPGEPPAATMAFSRSSSSCNFWRWSRCSCNSQWTCWSSRLICHEKYAWIVSPIPEPHKNSIWYVYIYIYVHIYVIPENPGWFLAVSTTVWAALLPIIAGHIIYHLYLININSETCCGSIAWFLLWTCTKALLLKGCWICQYMYMYIYICTLYIVHII